MYYVGEFRLFKMKKFNIIIFLLHYFLLYRQLLDTNKPEGNVMVEVSTDFKTVR